MNDYEEKNEWCIKKKKKTEEEISRVSFGI